MDFKNRMYLSVTLVALGIILAMVSGILVNSTDGNLQAQGIVIDYGNYDTVWTDAEVSDFDTEIDLLRHVCDENGFSLEISDDGNIISIDGKGSGDKKWDLWVIHPGETNWVKVDAPYNQNPADYTISSWSYLKEGDTPTVGVDYLGNPIYGFAQKYRVVSLSPTISEILGSIKAVNVVVGADSYSNYPESIVSGKADGSIKTIGTYTSPSFELITGTNPDVVFCDGSQRSHMQMSKQLRDADIDAMLLYPGEDLRSILNNIFIVGTVMKYDLAAEQVIKDTDEVIDELTDHIISSGANNHRDVMIALDPDISPWVSGDGTYVDNITELFNSSNVFSDWAGWVHITSDRIPYANPDVIIIITSDYRATQEEYDHLYNNLSAQWKDTDAWKSGNVYVICEGAADMAQRFGPRTAQMSEIVSMILHPDAFEIKLPKIIGDNYPDYLTYSKYMEL